MAELRSSGRALPVNARPCSRLCDTLRKTEMNASTHRKCEINKRHKIAQEVLKSSSSCVLQSCGINMWRMESLSLPCPEIGCQLIKLIDLFDPHGIKKLYGKV